VGQAILPRGPLRGRLSAGSGRLKGGCGQNWPPSKIKLTHYQQIPRLLQMGCVFLFRGSAIP
jgi:hypothetical protein